MADSAVEEANHVVGEIRRVVEEDVVAAVLELEDLRPASAVVLVALDDAISTLG